VLVMGQVVFPVSIHRGENEVSGRQIGQQVVPVSVFQKPVMRRFMDENTQTVHSGADQYHCSDIKEGRLEVFGSENSDENKAPIEQHGSCMAKGVGFEQSLEGNGVQLFVPCLFIYLFHISMFFLVLYVTQMKEDLKMALIDSHVFQKIASAIRSKPLCAGCK